ncbi:PAS domain-containing sensor histidine kinase [Pseudemcibacter aquimaris]|uniref:PAS domain-containing sensor histidine kinase n=1 Tax=Pseudemcibacter aquimaris TaxID=2857064 RepID=UPI002013442A|nr:PAS domain-containing sensor histidine kinase [Pseudemcibacter aquimaris]MCC3861017.1 PAS domain-containing sensor histidine kinase [Pseudemcibacter aquimaris]
MNNKFLAAIIEATPNAVYIKDEDGVYLMINEKGAQSVGKTVEDFLGKDDTEVFPPELAKKVMALDRSVFEGESFNGEERVDDYIVFLSHKFILEDEETNERVLVGISTDISELKKTEEELSEARIKADEANKHKSTFLQNMSHELRTPLNAIIGFSSILSGESGADDEMFKANFKEYAKLINSSGVHLLAIINDLLDLSKIEAGEQEFNENTVDVCYEVESCIQTLRAMAIQNDITIIEEFPEDDILIRGDEKILRQMVYNLLSNAVKYSYHDGEVTVRLRHRNSGGLDISIIDKGIGMSADDLHTAMIPFRRSSQVKDSEITGTGLGLPLVDAFIKLFQGHLEIQSERGIGTSATLHFPPERSIEE